MIQTRLQVLLILVSISLIVAIWQLIVRGKLRPAYAILWLISSSLFFLLVILRKPIHDLANFFQVAYTPSFIFAMGLLFTIILLLSQSVVISNMSKKIIELAQHYALIKWKQDQLVEQSKRFERFAIQMLNKYMHEKWRLTSIEQEGDDENILLQMILNSSTHSNNKISPFLPESISDSTNCSDDYEEEIFKVSPFIIEMDELQEQTYSPSGEKSA